MPITPVVELALLDDVAAGNGNAQIFENYDTEENWHAYWGAIVQQLRNARGLYIFYDSMIKPLYVGRAVDQSIWDRANQSFNRARGGNRRDTFRYLHVAHPSNNVQPGPNRRIRRSSFTLYDVATHFSAYSIPGEQIPELEAFCIRAFAGVLLNTRFEGLGTPGLPAFDED